MKIYALDLLFAVHQFLWLDVLYLHVFQVGEMLTQKFHPFYILFNVLRTQRAQIWLIVYGPWHDYIFNLYLFHQYDIHFTFFEVYCNEQKFSNFNIQISFFWFVFSIYLLVTNVVFIYLLFFKITLSFIFVNLMHVENAFQFLSFTHLALSPSMLHINLLHTFIYLCLFYYLNLARAVCVTVESGLSFGA